MNETADVEAEITTHIILREQYVNRLKKGLTHATAAQLQKRLLKSLDLLDMLRTITLDIVEEIQHWRRGLPKPFVYKNQNYLLKLTTDCDFLNDIKPLVRWLGFTLKRNPFFTLKRKLRQNEMDLENQMFPEAKLLLAPIDNERLLAAEDTLRREEIHHGQAKAGRREFGGRPPTPPADDSDITKKTNNNNDNMKSTHTSPKLLTRKKMEAMNGSNSFPSSYNSEIIMKEILADIKHSNNDCISTDSPHNANSIKMLEKMKPSEVLLRDRVRRKLLILKQRPNTRKKLIRIANRSGRTSKLKPEELLNIIQRNGIDLTAIESEWLILYLDPNRLNQLYVEDLLSLLEIAGSAEYDSNSNDNDDFKIPPHLLQNEDDVSVNKTDIDESVNGTQYRRYSEKQLNEIAKLELEMQDLMNEISRAEDETAWWTHQKEWEEATVRSVVARRARLQKTQKEIDKRFKEIANIKKEIQRRKDRIVAIKAMTREHRLKIAKAQAEKAKYHMVQRYEEAVKWDAEKKAIAQAALECEEKRKAQQQKERKKRKIEHRRRRRERDTAAREIQRVVRGRFGRKRYRRIKIKKLKRLKHEQEQRELSAIRIQKLIRGNKARSEINHKKKMLQEKKNAAKTIQNAARRRKKRKEARRKLREQRVKRAKRDLEFRLNPDKFVHPLLWDEEAITKHSHSQQVLLFISNDMSPYERLGFLHSLVKLVPGMFVNVPFPLKLDAVLSVLQTGASCLIHAEIGLSASTRSQFNASVLRIVKQVNETRTKLRRDALNKGYKHDGFGRLNASLLNHPMPKVILVAGWHSVGYIGDILKHHHPATEHSNVKHVESIEDAAAVKALDISAKNEVADHLKDHLINIEQLLRGILETSSINKQNYSEQLLEMVHPSSKGLAPIVYVLEALGIIICHEKHKVFDGPSNAGSLGEGFSIVRKLIKRLADDVNKNAKDVIKEELKVDDLEAHNAEEDEEEVAFLNSEAASGKLCDLMILHIRHVSLSKISSKNANSLRRYVRSARWGQIDVQHSIFHSLKLYVEYVTNYALDMHKRGGPSPKLMAKHEGGKVFDRIILLQKQPKLKGFPSIYMACCHVVSEMLHDKAMMKAGRNIPEIKHDESAATYEGVKISHAISRRPGLLAIHHTTIESGNHTHTGGRIFVEFFDLTSNCTYFASVAESALGRLIAPPIVQNAPSRAFQSLDEMYRRIIDTVTIVGHHSKYRPNPDLALLRHQTPVLRVEKRVFEPHAPRGLGQLTLFKVWEGAPGDIVLDAYLVHAKLSCHRLVSWKMLRMLVKFGMFQHGMLDKDHMAVKCGHMKDLARFVLSRLAFSHNNLWLRTEHENKDNIMILRFSGEYILDERNVFAAVYSGQDNWIVQVLMEINIFEVGFEEENTTAIDVVDIHGTIVDTTNSNSNGNATVDPQIDPRNEKTEVLLALSIRNQDVDARAKYSKWGKDCGEDFVPGKELLDWIQVVPLSPEEVKRKGRSRAGISKMRSPRELGLTDSSPIALQLKRIPRHGKGTGELPRLLVVDTETMKDVIVQD
eukprot:g1125.t1